MGVEETMRNETLTRGEKEMATKTTYRIQGRSQAGEWDEGLAGSGPDCDTAAEAESLLSELLDLGGDWANGTWRIAEVETDDDEHEELYTHYRVN